MANSSRFRLSAAVVAAALLAPTLLALGQSPALAVSTPASTSVVAGGGWGDGGAAVSARLRGSVATATDPQGRLVLVDTDSNSVRRVEGDGTITCLVACSHVDGFAGDGGAASSAKLSSPTDVAVASDGSLYISDTGNHRIRRVSVGGVITTFAGTGQSSADAGWNAGGAATTIALTPEALVVAPNGTVFVADLGSSPSVSYVRTVRAITSAGGLTTVVGRMPATTPSESWSAGFEGAASTDVDLRFITDLALHSDGSLLIAHNDRRILRAVVGGAIQTVAGITGAAYIQTPTSPDGTPALTADLAGVGGLDVAGDDVYFTDGSAIRRFSIGGNLVTASAEGASGSVAVTADGVVAEGSCSQTCLRLHASPAAPVTVVGAVSNGVGDGGPASKGAFLSVGGLLQSSDGSVYISDTEGDRVRRVAPDGTLSTFAGSSVIQDDTFSGEGGAATAAVVPGPTWLAERPDGSILVACSDRTLRSISTLGVITTIAGTGVGDWGTPIKNLPAGPMAGTSMILKGVQSMVVDVNGAVWMVDGETSATDGRVLRLSADDTIERVTHRADTLVDFYDPALGATIGELQGQRSVAIDPSGRIVLGGQKGLLTLDATGVVVAEEKGYLGYGLIGIDSSDRRIQLAGTELTRTATTGSTDRVSLPGSSNPGAAFLVPTLSQPSTQVLYATPPDLIVRRHQMAEPGVKPAAPTAIISATAAGASVKVTSAIPAGGDVSFVINPGSIKARNPEDGVAFTSLPSGDTQPRVINPADVTMGQPATAAFFARTADGSVSEPTFIAFTPRYSSVCTIKAAPVLLPYGGTTVVTATTKAPWASALAATPGVWKWTPKVGTAASVTATATGPSGMTSRSFKPTTSGRYTYTSQAKGAYAGCAASVDVQVSPTISIAVSANNVALGKTVTFSGLVSPSHRSATVVLQRYVGGKWVSAKTAKTTSTSRYAIAYKTTSRTDYSWRVTLAAHTDHAAGYSKSLKLTVR